jgi:hypothetical protein
MLFGLSKPAGDRASATVLSVKKRCTQNCVDLCAQNRAPDEMIERAASSDDGAEAEHRHRAYDGLG